MLEIIKQYQKHLIKSSLNNSDYHVKNACSSVCVFSLSFENHWKQREKRYRKIYAWGNLKRNVTFKAQ